MSDKSKGRKGNKEAKKRKQVPVPPAAAPGGTLPAVAPLTAPQRRK